MSLILSCLVLFLHPPVLLDLVLYAFPLSLFVYHCVLLDWTLTLTVVSALVFKTPVPCVSGLKLISWYWWSFDFLQNMRPVSCWIDYCEIWSNLKYLGYQLLNSLIHWVFLEQCEQITILFWVYPLQYLSKHITWTGSFCEDFHCPHRMRNNQWFSDLSPLHHKMLGEICQYLLEVLLIRI